MSREIKFRAWDEDNKVMLKPQDLSQSGAYWNWLGKIDAQLMQYTGLKDKNGKEIYEGDIVTVDGAIDKRGRVVTWDIAEYMLDPEYEPSDLGNLWLSQRLEVIGNIHVNPELLEE